MNFKERLAGLHKDLNGLALQAGKERDARLRGLQQAARSLRQAESSAQWVEILADAAAPLADMVFFFQLDGGSIRCQTVRGLEKVESAAIALADAPAFRQAVETKETVVALVAPSQLSLSVANQLGSRRKVHLFPLVGKTRVLGILLASDEAGPDVYGLEVLLSLGASSLELREAKQAANIAPASPLPAPARPAGIPTARQFARLSVAKWLLDEPARVSAGRLRGDLYGELKLAIDRADETFRTRYGHSPNYLHEEIINRLAQGNPALMGPVYRRVGGLGG